MWAKGAGEFIKGTGRLEAAKGSISFTGRGFTPSLEDCQNLEECSEEFGNTNDLQLDIAATYTLAPGDSMLIPEDKAPRIISSSEQRFLTIRDRAK